MLSPTKIEYYEWEKLKKAIDKKLDKNIDDFNGKYKKSIIDESEDVLCFWNYLFRRHNIQNGKPFLICPIDELGDREWGAKELWLRKIYLAIVDITDQNELWIMPNW